MSHGLSWVSGGGSAHGGHAGWKKEPKGWVKVRITPFPSPALVLWGSLGMPPKKPIHAFTLLAQGVFLLAPTHSSEPETGTCGRHSRRHLSPSSPSRFAERLRDVRSGWWSDVPPSTCVCSPQPPSTITVTVRPHVATTSTTFIVTMMQCHHRSHHHHRFRHH